MYYKIRDDIQTEQRKKQISDFIFTELVLFIILFMSVVIFLNTHVFFNVLVDGPSMQPTMYTGDVLKANMLKETKRGDIIVIDGVKKNSKGGYDWLIKRAIAFGGETVEIKNGKVYVYKTGTPEKELKEDYLPAGRQTWLDKNNKDQTLKVEVPEGHIFYLGDNRDNSTDSRQYGTCKESQIVGVVSDFALSTRDVTKFFYKIGQVLRGEAD